MQTEYEIIIDGMWRKRIKSEQSLFIEYDGNPLLPETKYNYKVRVWDNRGETSEFSESSFITGLMDKKPSAKWIASKTTSDSVSMFVKRFSCNSVNTAYVLLLNMDLTANKEEATRRLNEMVIDCGTRLNTGFLGTPYICFMLSKYGYTNTAYSLLLRTEYPSWLYPVTKGATTVWERWDGMRSDGTM